MLPLKINIIPAITIILINVLVIYFVVRSRGQTKAGFFLLVNAMSLVFWAGGQALFYWFEGAQPLAAGLPYLAALMVPANFLYYGLSRPRPIRPFWSSPVGLYLLFLPPVILAALENYKSYGMNLLFNYSYRVGQVNLDGWATRAALLYCIVMIGSALVVLGIRYYTTTGPDKNTAKHLIATIIGPLLFAGVFWASARTGPISIVPSPSLVFAITAQLGLIVILRQEEIRRPRILNRAVYYLTAVLVAFLLVHLMLEFFTFVQGGLVLDRTISWLVIGSTLLLLLVARSKPLQNAFERLMFSRAQEYRNLYQETRQELRGARERLRKTERLSVAGELAARLAHEIKNPLGPIKGYTQMMREKLEDDPAFTHRESFLRHLEVIAEEVENIDRRVRGFLNLARQPQLLQEPVDVNRLVRRCSQLLRLEISAQGDPPTGQRGVEIEMELDEELMTILGDQGRLEEALYNLARNALDATQEAGGGIIEFRTSEQKGPAGEEGVLIIVHDSGNGFKTELISKLFDPFFSEKEDGTGLGLSIVKSHIESHGGTVTLTNREDDEGGEARIWLPKVVKANPGAALPKP